MTPMRGELGVVSARDLLTMLAGAGASGTLVLTRGGVARTLRLTHGQPSRQTDLGGAFDLNASSGTFVFWPDAAADFDTAFDTNPDPAPTLPSRYPAAQGPLWALPVLAEQPLLSTAETDLRAVTARLERDGFVSGADADAEGHVVYRVTDAGRDEVAAWFTTPVARTTPPRDELAIKLALAVTVPGVDVGTVIQQQRSATMSALQDYTRLKRDRDTSTPDDLAWSLVLDSLIFSAEAEVRWLDHCEARLRRAALENPAAVPTTTPTTERTAR